MMKFPFQKPAWALAALVLATALGATYAQAQPFDHLACTKVRDLRGVSVPLLTLTPQQSEFLLSTGCTAVGGAQQKASEVCWPVDKSPSNPPGGLDLSGQNFVCYRVKCAANPSATQTSLTVTDQFAVGTVVANQRHRTRRLCVPSPTDPTPTPTVAPTPTPTPTAQPTPTPTPPYGSASKAFVQPVQSLLD